MGNIADNLGRPEPFDKRGLHHAHAPSVPLSAWPPVLKQPGRMGATIGSGKASKLEAHLYKHEFRTRGPGLTFLHTFVISKLLDLSRRSAKPVNQILRPSQRRRESCEERPEKPKTDYE